MNRFVARLDQIQPGQADGHPADQFAQHRRLTDPLRRTANLCHPQHDHQHGEQLRDLKVVHQPDLSQIGFGVESSLRGEGLIV